LHLFISAHDEQTDIQKFEYALGSWEGQTDIVDWRQAVGVTSNTGAGGSGVTRRMETVMQGLNLEHGEPVLHKRKGYQQRGKTSLFSMSDPVVYDAIPPSAPGYVTIIRRDYGTGNSVWIIIFLSAGLSCSFRRPSFLQRQGELSLRLCR
jgi:hypothetical protein